MGMDAIRAAREQGKLGHTFLLPLWKVKFEFNVKVLVRSDLSGETLQDGASGPFPVSLAVCLAFLGPSSTPKGRSVVSHFSDLC